ncbi:MAG: glycosyltransferase family 2 protein [Candidatus Roizmanbacteria bacterium]|nr:MAG: glycosyltransferase family 2 protein [Candidatus Roizmanbacteria bacterium]
MSNPAITVLLTTYKRPQYLKLAIRSVLSQNFKDFELIILDDASPDNTEEIIKKTFKDPRIIYIKNKKNLGFPGNFINGIKLSKGKYIFLFSDDDIIAMPDTLSVVYEQMEERKSGYAQLGLMFYEDNYYQPSFIATPIKKEILYIPPGEDILIKTQDWHFGFASGNIYRRDLLKLDDVINDVWFSHVKPIFRIIKKTGALYIGEKFIIGKFSKSGNVSYLNVDVNKEFHIRKLFEIYKEFDSSASRYNLYEKSHLDEVIKSLPGIKYYTSNKNVLTIAKEVLKINPSYQSKLFYWRSIILALIIPKSILGILRYAKLQLGYLKISKVIKEIKLKENIDKVLISPKAISYCIKR